MKNAKIKSNIKTMFALISFGLVLLLTGCANPNGLHNQQAAEVTFVFKNFGSDISGDYTIPGNFNDWNYKNSMVTLKNGEGTSEPVVISKVNIEFSLIQTNDSGWRRPWYPNVKGNGADKGTAGTPYQNFYIDGLDLNAGQIVLVMDGSSGTATPEVQQ